MKNIEIKIIKLDWELDFIKIFNSLYRVLGKVKNIITKRILLPIKCAA